MEAVGAISLALEEGRAESLRSLSSTLPNSKCAVSAAVTQKGAAFISLSYFHNEVLLIHEHNYIVLSAFCVGGREQSAELLLE